MLNARSGPAPGHRLLALARVATFEILRERRAANLNLIRHHRQLQVLHSDMLAQLFGVVVEGVPLEDYAPFPAHDTQLPHPPT